MSTSGPFSFSQIVNNLNITSGALSPAANGNTDLGSVNNRFRNLYMAGNLVSFGAGITFSGYDWSYLANYVIPPRVAANSDSTVVFTGVGQEHSAYIFQGDLYTFGRNNYGQLGHGDTTNRTVPIKVSGISGAAAVACGESFTVVLMADGTVRAAGFNNNGQLGDGTTTNRSTFVTIPGITNAIQVSCGINYTLIVRSNGTVVGFGSNSLGQLGNGSTSATNTSAVTMSLPSNTARFVACGAYFSVVLLNSGAAYGCGDNSYGQLALDPVLSPNVTTPVLYSGISNVVSAECGQYHTILVTYLGNIITIGRNDAGQLGINTKTSYNFTPQTIITQGTSGSLGLSTVVGAGLNHNAIVRGDNTIWVWGSNSFGQLGLGQTTTEALTPTQLPGGFTGYSVGCGRQHTVIRVNPDPTYVGRTTTLISFGDNTHGQMGDNNANVSIRWFPNRINDGTYAKRFFSGGDAYQNTGYIDSDGVAYMSGVRNNVNCMGMGHQDNYNHYNRPHALSMINNRLQALSCVSDSNRSCILALDKDGQIWSWGNDANNSGILGNGTLGNPSFNNNLVPYNITSVGSLTGNVFINVNNWLYNSAAIDTLGRVHIWGDRGGLSSLGDNIASGATGAPQLLTGGSLSGRSVVNISIGYYGGLALDSTGRVNAWGYGGDGQIGDGTILNSASGAVPKGVTGGTLQGKTILAIASGMYHRMALDTAGIIHTWGLGNEGQMGRNQNSSSNQIPAAVTGGSLTGRTVTAISGGYRHCLALDSTGRVHAWGRGNEGQIGNSTTNTYAVPIAVTGGSISGQTITSIFATGDQSYALDATGNIHAWGNNASGVLGFGTTSIGSNILVPTLVNTTSRDLHRPHLSSGAGYHKLICNTTVGNSITNDTPTAGTLLRVAGTNTHRQIGDNTTTDRYSPVTITNFTGGNIVSAANSQFHSAVVLSNGVVFAWGRNDYGQCGNTVGNPIGVPTVVAGIQYGVEVVCGDDFTLVRNQDSSVYAFGRNNVGQLGISTTTVSTFTFTPTLATVTGISRIVAGTQHAMGVTSLGRVWAWGDNTYGKLGLNSASAFIDTPTQVSTGSFNFSTVRDIGLGQHFSVAICTDKTVYSAGLNNLGQLGRSTNFGTTSGNSTFGLVSLSPYEMTPVEVACGDAHTVLLMSNNQVIVWGDNSNNQAPGSGTFQPILLRNYIEVMHVTAGKNTTHLEFPYGTSKNFITLGNQKTFGRRHRVALGAQHSVYIRGNGDIYTWGSAQNGQLNGGAYNADQTASQGISANGSISGLQINEIAAGSNTTFFIDSTGRIHGTGLNGVGELGDGTLTQRNTAVLCTTGNLASKYFVSICNSISTQTELYAFTNFSFTNTGLTGRTGPTLSQCRTSYGNSGWYMNNSFFNMVDQGIQLWTVPKSGWYYIQCTGQYNTDYTINSAFMSGYFFFNAGQIIKILVGQISTSISWDGNGGSFVATQNNVPLIVAGGAAGGGAQGNTTSAKANLSTAGNNNSSYTVTGGSGGSAGNGTGSGAGFYTSSYSANSFINGGAGTLAGNAGGGFGCGGGAGGGSWGSGGGGGYSGGAGGSSGVNGGGGGSYNIGSNQSNSIGTYNGQVYIAFQCT